MPPKDPPPMDLGTAIFCAAGGDAELAQQGETNALDASHSPEGYGISDPSLNDLNTAGAERAETVGAVAGGAAIINNFSNCHP